LAIITSCLEGKSLWSVLVIDSDSWGSHSANVPMSSEGLLPAQFANPLRILDGSMTQAAIACVLLLAVKAPPGNRRKT
jgi:hypothetical protein